jgi:hypothetical protein
MRRTIVYLSGAMTGIVDYNHPAFNQMESKLVDQGCVVINPAVLPLGLKDEHYMDIAMAMVRSCDCIVMLEGWQESQGGAQAELALAKRLGKRIIEQADNALEIVA